MFSATGASEAPVFAQVVKPLTLSPRDSTGARPEPALLSLGACGTRRNISWPSPRSSFSHRGATLTRSADGGVARTRGGVRRAAHSAARLDPARTTASQPLVRWALEHSPTFRQQCRALAAAPELRATRQSRLRPPGATARARTSFRSTSGARSPPRSNPERARLDRAPGTRVRAPDRAARRRRPARAREKGRGAPPRGWRVRDRPRHCRRAPGGRRSRRQRARPHPQRRRVGLAGAAPRRADRESGVEAEARSGSRRGSERDADRTREP